MTPVLRCAKGVTFGTPAPGGFRLLAAFDAACLYLKRDLTITAGTDHHTTGRHVAGEAYDLSVKDLLPSDIRRLVEFLRLTLGGAFGVFYETQEATTDPMLVPVSLPNPDATGPHIHAQVRKGTMFPPPELRPEALVT